MSAPEARERRRARWQKLCALVQFPEALPVSKRAQDLVEALQRHEVLIVAGETGSGKTTQVPKCALLAGLGQHGRILMTQPRRLAAVRTALRIAEELGLEVGDEVGYRVRFQHKATEETLLEVVTDGIPLSGDLSNKPFRHCEAVIVDEVHERSVNIDLLLGLLKLERERNPRLKVVLMSATLDTERYREFFPEAVPFEVEGRTFPVKIEYRDTNSDDSTSDRLCEAVEQAIAPASGDILCFLPTERDIRDCERRLAGRLGAKVEVLPLYSRLSQKEQDLVFRPSAGRQRVILSTNIAETSLTLPEVRCVIDSGLARILRFQPGRGVPLLEVESISKASAKQRCGRAGRTAAGRCIRLYSERDYLAMEEFTVPEIQRQDLAQVILKLVSMGVREPESFPFPDKPTSRSMKSGENQLEFLGAVLRKEDGLHLTALGKEMVRLPLAPRLAHLMLKAQKENQLSTMAVISAFLSMQDPRQSPADQLAKARDAHRRFQVAESDFLSMLELYSAYLQQMQLGSGNALKRWCSDNFLSWRRMKEWEQLALDLAKTVDGEFREIQLGPSSEEVIHRLILGSHLDGLLERDIKSDDGSYVSLGRRSIFPHPSSGLSKSKAPWAVCASFLNTSRLFALHLCEINPQWVSELAPHLVQKERGEPRYDDKSQKVVSEETHRFRSHVVKTIARKDHFTHDPLVATEVFIREAILRGALEWEPLQASRNLVEQLENFDAALRIRGACHNEDRLVDAWRRRLGLCSRFSDLKKCEPEKFQLRIEDVLDVGELQHWRDDYPMAITIDHRLCPLHYTYAPGSKDDGATVWLHPMDLALVQQKQLESCVPVWLEERLRLAQECLPKAFKKEFSGRSLRSEWLDMWEQNPDQSLLKILERWMLRHTGLKEVVEAWLKQWQERCAPHLRPSLSLIAADGSIGERNWDVQDSQLHNLASMEERHLVDFKKRHRQILGNSSDKPMLLLSKALSILYEWPEAGLEATSLKGKTISLRPRIFWRQEQLLCEPDQNEESSWRESILCCARLHGPLGEREAEPDPKLLDSLSKAFDNLAELKQKALEASWEVLWLRIRPSDLKNLKSLRERLKKLEEKYWSRDLKKILEICDQIGRLWLRTKWLHPQSSQEHWLYRRCAKASYSGRPDPSYLVQQNFEAEEREIQACWSLLDQHHRSPQGFDDLCKHWRQIEKDWSQLCKKDLYADCYKLTGTWEGDLLGGPWTDASPQSLALAQKTLLERQQLTEQMQRRWNEVEEWLQEAQDDLVAECHAKTATKKSDWLKQIAEQYPDMDSRRKAIFKFVAEVESLREQWSKLKTQKKVVLAEEKNVGNDKLKEALLTAWSGKGMDPKRR